MRHPEPELIAMIRGELPPAERERIAAHLGSCAECRAAYDTFVRILGDLKGARPAPPEIHWGRWQAELRGRLAGPPLGRSRRSWWSGRPAWAGLSIAVALALIAIALPLRLSERPGVDLGAVEEVAIGRRLELVREFSLLERLELLEDFELIRQLDALATRGEG